MYGVARYVRFADFIRFLAFSIRCATIFNKILVTCSKNGHRYNVKVEIRMKW